MSGHSAARHITSMAIGIVAMLISLSGETVNTTLTFASGACLLAYTLSALNRGD